MRPLAAAPRPRVVVCRAVTLALLAVLGCRATPPYVCRDCNVVLISMDTLRADHVGAYGYGRATTPNIDALARRGVLFAQAVSQSSWTRPAHMSMFTGLYPIEHGFIGLADRGPLADSIETLAQRFSRYGYTTVAFTGGINLAAEFGFDRGFSSYRTNGKYFRDNLEETRYWLDQHGDEKFFLFWHGYDAHTPYFSDPIDRRALSLEGAPPRAKLRRTCKQGNRGRIRRFIDQYDAAIHRGDRYVGKLLAELERRGLLSRTIVAFTSDHGEEFLEHGGCFHINTLYAEVLDVPLIVVAPGLPVKRIETLVPASVTIARTLLDLAGVPSKGFPGASLVPLLNDSGTPALPLAVSETRRRIEAGRGRGHVRSLTTARGKLIHWITLGTFEYFERALDPRELHPRIDDPDAKRLMRSLTEWLYTHAPRARAAEPTTGSEVRRHEIEELERELRGLGYVE